jgi:hypothetical protein
MLAAAIEAEVEGFIEQHHSLQTETNKAAIVRNGYLPERTIQTGLGDIAIKVPKVRDRTHSGLKFNSQLVPPYLKRGEASVRHLAPQDRFWDSMSQKSIRHEANLLGSSRPASATDYAQKTLRQGYHKWLYGCSSG